jgi:hypothetical protein
LSLKVSEDKQEIGKIPVLFMAIRLDELSISASNPKLSSNYPA